MKRKKENAKNIVIIVSRIIHNVQGVPRNMTVGESFLCRPPYTVLDSKSKGFMQFISFKKSFAQLYFTLKLIFR